MTLLLDAKTNMGRALRAKKKKKKLGEQRGGGSSKELPALCWPFCFLQKQKGIYLAREKKTKPTENHLKGGQVGEVGWDLIHLRFSERERE